MNILILGEKILAVDVTDAGDRITSNTGCFPKSVITGYQIVDATLPAGYVPGKYIYSEGAVIPCPVQAMAACTAMCATRCQEAAPIFTAKIAAGLSYGGNLYQIDNDSQNSIGKRAIYAGWSKEDPTNFPWIDLYSRGWWDINNDWHAMTASEFALFAKAVSDYVSACAATCRDHKNAMTAILNGAGTAEEKAAAITAYDIQAGW